MLKSSDDLNSRIQLLFLFQILCILLLQILSIFGSSPVNFNHPPVKNLHRVCIQSNTARLEGHNKYSQCKFICNICILLVPSSFGFNLSMLVSRSAYQTFQWLSRFSYPTESCWESFAEVERFKTFYVERWKIKYID